MPVNWAELRRALMGERTTVLPPGVALPRLPDVAVTFARRADDPQVSTAQLGRIIEADAGLTTELLRYVNSSAEPRDRVRTAQQAITRLSVRASNLFLLSISAQHALKAQKSRLINLQRFWLANLERALVAKHVATLLRTDPDIAFAGSMLSDSLLPVFTDALFSEYLKYAETPERVCRPLVDFERETFGWDHAVATAEALASWRFPDELVCAVLLHHGGLALLSDPDLGRTSVAAVAVAALLPDALRQSRDGLEQLQKLEALWPAFDLAEIADRVAAQFVDLSPHAGQHFTLQRRLEKRGALLAAK